MIRTVDEYQKSLEALKRETNSFSRIAGLLLFKLKEYSPVTTATSLAFESFVSNATITKFIKQLGFNNFNELAFVHNQNKEVSDTPIVSSNDEYKKVAELIEASRKILMIGVSNSFLINSDFANKLQRIDKWVVITPSKYEQVGFSKILTEEDLLIVNSVSLQHTWMIDIIKNTKASTILISSVDPSKVGAKPNFFFRLDAKEKADQFRIITEQNRIMSLNIFDNIFNRLIEDEKNYKILKKTSYK